ncbi:methionyl-tRNA formyltransferase [Xiamenia xianingshaonis]|nr:methionyl-tRNA formyltransferase [Xiamenia xianingshaonis]
MLGQTRMRVVFMGTPAFAARILKPLSQAHDVVAVYTRPDAVRGRGRKTDPSPVKAAAEELGIPAFTPKTLRDEGEQVRLAALVPDVIVVAAYGAILPQAVLDIPKCGCVNVHASLLPRWRGAAPIERAVLAGDEEVGVCIMAMEAGLDTGDFCERRAVDAAGKSADELTCELADRGADALLVALDDLQAGTAVWTKQDESAVTYADKIAKGELNLSLDDEVEQARRKVLASSAAHPSKACVAGRSCTIVRAASVTDEQGLSASSDLLPGEARFASKRLFLGCADGPVEIIEIKPDGKQAMAAKAFGAGLQNNKQSGLAWEAVNDR